MRYSIEGQELTDIADALRRRHGEIKEVIESDVYVSKTPNAIDKDNYSGRINESYIETVKIDGANRIIVTLNYSSNGFNPLYVAAGEYTKDNFPISDDIRHVTNSSRTAEEITFDNTDSVTFYMTLKDEDPVYGYYYATCIGYTDVRKTYQSSEMAQAIDDIPQAPPEGAFVLTGDCTYKFAYGGWNWFIETFGNKITTNNIKNAERMFNNNTELTEIPFTLNFEDKTRISMIAAFYNMSNLEKTPKINVPNPLEVNLNSIFQSCSKITDLNGVFENEAEFGDMWRSYIGKSEYSNHYLGALFQGCYSLRSVPTWFYEFKLNPASTKYPYTSYTLYYNTFSNCYTIDEIKDVPVWKCAEKQTKQMFNNMFVACYRLKTFTFETNEDGTPIATEWKTQTIDLTNFVGLTSISRYVTGNGGITADKEVKDDATYQALKDDPDWFTAKTEYSRYNHDSAVATINSLPDTSAYLASAGGTNTIKFLGKSGSATDGGAINTLTAEEIAVATAKGWTVTFV